MLKLDINNSAPRDCQLRFLVLWTSDKEELISPIKLRVNPQVSLTQSHEGRYVQDP
jgi:hypothetical protein